MKEKFKEFLPPFIKQLIAVYAFGFASNLIISAVMLIIGFADPEMRGAGSSFIDYTGTVRAVAAMNLQYTPIPFVLMYTAMIIIQRGSFTYGDEREQWRVRGRKLAVINLIVYFILALPSLIWFAEIDVGALYDRTLILSIYEKGYGNYAFEPDWIISNFGPYAAAFRLTKSYLPAAALVVTVIPALTTLLYLIPKKRKNIAIPKANDE